VRKRAHPATYPRFGRAARSHSHTQHHARRGQPGSSRCCRTPRPHHPPRPNTFVEITHVTLIPQELIPGTSCRSVAFMTWHVEVPMLAIIWPGSTARAAARSRGHRRCQQPLQCPPGSPVHAATRADREPARSPRWPIGLTMSRLQVPATKSHGRVLALTELIGASGRDLIRPRDLAQVDGVMSTQDLTSSSRLEPKRSHCQFLRNRQVASLMAVASWVSKLVLGA
jgi:hypothetical protein